MKLPWKTNNAPAIAFVVLAMAGGVGLYSNAHKQTDLLYRSQIGGCERQNVLRMESNDRIPAHQADTRVLHDFLMSAAAARAANFDQNHQQSDLQAAHEYRHLAVILEEKVHFDAVPIVNCTKVIQHP